MANKMGGVGDIEGREGAGKEVGEGTWGGGGVIDLPGRCRAAFEG